MEAGACWGRKNRRKEKAAAAAGNQTGVCLPILCDDRGSFLHVCVLELEKGMAVGRGRQGMALLLWPHASSLILGAGGE